MPLPPPPGSAPDHLQVLYKRVCEYLEIDSRVEVHNTRFVVLQEFLDLLREHQNNKHRVRLEVSLPPLAAGLAVSVPMCVRGSSSRGGALRLARLGRVSYGSAPTHVS